MNLYEIASGMQMLLDGLDDGTYTEEDIADTLDSLQMDFEDKAYNTAAYIRNLQAHKKDIEEEIARLKEKASTVSNRIDRTKEWLKNSMEVAGIKKMQAGIFNIRTQTAGGKAPIIYMVDPDKLSDEYRIDEVIHKPNQDKIREFLAGGGVSDQFALGERSTVLMIK